MIISRTKNVIDYLVSEENLTVWWFEKNWTMKSFLKMIFHVVTIEAHRANAVWYFENWTIASLKIESKLKVYTNVLMQIAPTYSKLNKRYVTIEFRNID